VAWWLLLIAKTRYGSTPDAQASVYVEGPLLELRVSISKRLD
jgi:hypothetical protein